MTAKINNPIVKKAGFGLLAGFIAWIGVLYFGRIVFDQLITTGIDYRHPTFEFGALLVFWFVCLVFMVASYMTVYLSAWLDEKNIIKPQFKNEYYKSKFGKVQDKLPEFMVSMNNAFNASIFIIVFSMFIIGIGFFTIHTLDSYCTLIGSILALSGMMIIFALDITFMVLSYMIKRDMIDMEKI